MAPSMELTFRIYKHMSIHGYTVARVYVTEHHGPSHGILGGKMRDFPHVEPRCSFAGGCCGCWWLAKMFLVVSCENLDYSQSHTSYGV
jgi:hypothetical protein